MSEYSSSRDLIIRPLSKELADASVLQVIDNLEPHGLARSAVDVAKALAARGATSLIVSSGGALVPEARIAGADHINLMPPAPNPLKMRLMQRQIARLIQKHKVDIVHVRSAGFAWPALRAAKAAGCASISTVSDVSAETGGFFTRRYERAFTGADHIIAISDFIAEKVRTLRAVPTERLSVIHRGIDLARFNPAAIKAQRLIALARRYALPDDRAIILAAGSITARNGFDHLIEAIAKMDRDDVFCLILGDEAGDPQAGRALESLIEARGLGGKVRLGGHCDDMPAAYMLADVVAAPTIEPEAFGRVCVEAQAMGRPVVACRHGGARETVLDGETGWLVPPGDDAALAQALMQAVQLDAAARRTIAMKTRSRIVTSFGRERMCEQVLARYSLLLAPHGD
ncbi:glycosyl transferase [Iodidimonas gelatinilytica]|uniref:Glycosyl transferase n=1 Tax=Iodidimonas gelatinilytica TaxID=1236966 RepID=A0A5A7MQW0_9PROT|nr:glycosyltransferase family 4 protein [Iodidimonas gelatinilytica]GEQ97593.1 glycosyl transferase [Iodidimonas gelatinilytica]